MRPGPRRRSIPWAVARGLSGPDAGDGGLPGPRPRLRDGGNLRAIFVSGLLDAMSAWSRGSGGREFVYWTGLTPHLVVSQPDLIREVVTDGERFLRNDQPTRALFGRGLLRLDGEASKRRRALLSGAFRAAELSRAVPIIADAVDGLADAWGAGASAAFSPNRDASFLMLQIIGRYLLGFEFVREEHGGKPLHRALVTLSSGAVLRHILPRSLVDVVTARATRSARRQLDGLCREVLATPPSTPFRAALDQALARGELDLATVIDELRTFLIAGHETSATALSWTLAMLATHPEVQAAARAEAEAVGPLRSVSDLERLTYTTQVIRESMRLFPPVPLSIYVAAKDTRLGAWSLPRGTRIDIASYVVHRDPDLWPAPTSFDPRRFAARAEVASHTYFPFLFGPHACLGLRLAMMELQIAVARLVTRFELSAPEGPPRANLRISLHPAGFRLRVRPAGGARPARARP